MLICTKRQKSNISLVSHSFIGFRYKYGITYGHIVSINWLRLNKSLLLIIFKSSTEPNFSVMTSGVSLYSKVLKKYLMEFAFKPYDSIVSLFGISSTNFFRCRSISKINVGGLSLKKNRKVENYSQLLEKNFGPGFELQLKSWEKVLVKVFEAKPQKA